MKYKIRLPESEYQTIFSGNSVHTVLGFYYYQNQTADNQDAQTIIITPNTIQPGTKVPESNVGKSFLWESVSRGVSPILINDRRYIFQFKTLCRIAARCDIAVYGDGISVAFTPDLANADLLLALKPVGNCYNGFCGANFPRCLETIGGITDGLLRVFTG